MDWYSSITDKKPHIKNVVCTDPADESGQFDEITALKNRVSELEKELQVVKDFLKGNTQFI